MKKNICLPLIIFKWDCIWQYFKYVHYLFIYLLYLWTCCQFSPLNIMLIINIRAYKVCKITVCINNFITPVYDLKYSNEVVRCVIKMLDNRARSSMRSLKVSLIKMNARSEGKLGCRKWECRKRAGSSHIGVKNLWARCCGRGISPLLYTAHKDFRACFPQTGWSSCRCREAKELYNSGQY